MKNMLEYKGYYTKIEYTDEDGVFFGEVLDIDDLVSFEGETIEELKKDFIDAVDFYLESCKERGKEPNKPYKGSFNVRIKPELHRKAVICSESEDISLNQFIENAVREKVASYEVLDNEK